MRTSENINELAAALAKAQAKIENAPLNKSNPHFKSKYADLAAIREAVTKPLTDQGLSYVQMTGKDDAGQFVLFTRLMHTSGQWLESVYPLPVSVDKQQAMGSAITYARRYSLAAVCGVAAEEDDDGNAASQRNGAPAQQQPARTYQASASRGAAQKQAETPQPAAPKADPITVIDANGEEQPFSRTKRGALAAMEWVEQEIDAVQRIEDQAALWRENRAAFLKLAETESVKDLRPAEGAQTIAERVHVNEKAFREHLEAA